MKDSFQDRLLKLQIDFHHIIRSAPDPRKFMLTGLRITRDAFDVAQAGIGILNHDQSGIDVQLSIPKNVTWEKDILFAYLAGNRPTIPDHTILAPLERRHKPWGVLALSDPNPGYTRLHIKSLFTIAQHFTDGLERLDRDRVRKVRHKIESKIAAQQNPKDLVYDILHGLRSLTNYDHSASLFIEKDGQLELVAEQIAWRKAKSKRIGLRLDISPKLRGALSSEKGQNYHKKDKHWFCNERTAESSFIPLFEYKTLSEEMQPVEVSMVCAPFVTPDQTLCVLKLSSYKPHVLGSYETELVNEFLPLASLAVQFASQVESLHDRMLHSERKHVLANVARGIAHDVNNALGSILPLVQQLQEEAKEDKLEPQTVQKDLEDIEQQIKLCRRIFESMLAIARGNSNIRYQGQGNLRKAIDEALSILKDSMKKANIAIELELPYELPPIETGQTALTQLFMNLCTNAKDAMETGGLLKIAAQKNGKSVKVAIQDTGIGIPKAHLSKLQEPFFTTKPEGNGLGLSICRSIISDSGGNLEISSTEGQGTTIHLSLPIVSD